jgi:hypothetical protein
VPSPGTDKYSSEAVFKSLHFFGNRCVACVENWPTLDRLARKFHGLPDDCYRIKSKDEIKTQMKRISTADHLARVFALDHWELRFRAMEQCSFV